LHGAAICNKMKAKRLFLGIRIPDSLSDLLSGITAAGNIRLNFTPKENLHITVQFLGNISEENIPELLKKLSGVKEFSSFFLQPTGYKEVRKRGKLEMVWVTFFRSEEFIALANYTFRVLGTKPDHAPQPHITLVRCKGLISENPFKILPDISEFSFRVDQLILFESILGKSSSTYIELYQWNLKN
jgi:RNA 2',3'-cyclic 3'-phosphodiesterase